MLSALLQKLSAEGGIWTLAPLLTTYSLSRGAPSATWVLLLIPMPKYISLWGCPKTERVGFEPTRPFGQTVFKTASLWPLRYLSKRAFQLYITHLCLSSTFFQVLKSFLSESFFGLVTISISFDSLDILSSKFDVVNYFFHLFLVWESFHSRQRVLLPHSINILYNMIEILEYIDFFEFPHFWNLYLWPPHKINIFHKRDNHNWQFPFRFVFMRLFRKSTEKNGKTQNWFYK